MTKEEFLVLVDVAGIGEKKSTYGASYGDLRRFAKLFSGRKWVGLTEAEIYELMDNEDEFDLARAIEAKLKEKNSG